MSMERRCNQINIAIQTNWGEVQNPQKSPYTIPFSLSCSSESPVISRISEIVKPFVCIFCAVSLYAF